jgi:geranylgeranyl pyrophosphate synthase
LEHRDRLLFKQIARDLGFVFQVRDDILDVESSSDILGKSIGKDADQQKITAVSLLGLEDAKKLETYLIEQIQSSLRQIQTVDIEAITAYYDSLYGRKN